jgi:hypothetical protein
VKLNNKTSWNPPTTKNHNGLFEIIEQAGTLTFNFTVNPIQYKLNMQKIQQQIEQG